jgi:hypothetical protein
MTLEDDQCRFTPCAHVSRRVLSRSLSAIFIDVPTNPGPRSFCARPAHWCHYARAFNPYSIVVVCIIY